MIQQCYRRLLVLPLALLSTTTAFSPLRAARHFSTARAMSSTAAADIVVPGRPTWQQTMLRIKDPAKTLSFYTELLGMTLIDKFDFPQYKFSLYFVATLPKGEIYTLTPGTQEAHEYLWSYEGVTLELTHNHGTETDVDFSYHAGNQEKDGFGHVAVK
jgi:lactoylglutathione lyase